MRKQTSESLDFDTELLTQSSSGSSDHINFWNIWAHYTCDVAFKVSINQHLQVQTIDRLTASG